MLSETRKAAQAVALMGAALLLLYIATAQRGVCWQDSGMLQLRALTGQSEGVEGIARLHPLYVWCLQGLAALAPTKLALWLCNACSGLGMAVAASLTAWLIWRLNGKIAVACGMGLLLGVAHMAWWLATITETYTWSLALFMGELLALFNLAARSRRRDLVIAALFNGLGLAVHNLALLSLPVWVGVALWLIFVAKRVKITALLGAGVVWFLAATPWWVLILRRIQGGATLASTLHEALFGIGYQQIVTGYVPAVPVMVIVANMALFGLCLASPLWLGLWWARRAHSAAASRRIWRVALLALTVLHGLFFIRYFVADQTTFALPTLALLTIWCGVGWGELVTTSTWWRRHIVPVLALGVLCQMWSPAVAYLVVCHTKIEPTRLRTLLYRNEPRYWLLSWKHNENSAGRFAADALRQCPTNTLLYADATVAAPLLVSRQLRLLGDGGATIASYYDTWTRDPQQWRAWLERHQLDHFYVASPIMGYLPAGVEPDKMRVTMLGALYKLESGGHAAVSNKQNGSNDIYKHEANRTENNGDK